MTPWTVPHQASQSMGFSRQEYWSGYPFPSPGIEPRSPGLQADSLPSEPLVPSISECFNFLCNYSDWCLSVPCLASLESLGMINRFVFAGVTRCCRFISCASWKPGINQFFFNVLCEKMEFRGHICVWKVFIATELSIVTNPFHVKCY